MNKSTVFFYLVIGQLFLSSFVVAGPLPIEVLYAQLAIIFGIFIILYVVLLLALKICKIPLKWGKYDDTQRKKLIVTSFTLYPPVQMQY